MSARTRTRIRSEGIEDVIRKTYRNLQQAIRLRRTYMGNGGLNKMPGTLQFVQNTQSGPAFHLTLKGEISVEIAVCILGGGNERDSIVYLRL